jgi:hypothetical protein
VKRLAPLAACLAIAVVVVGAPAADTVGPSLALNESSPYEYLSGSTLYYSPTGSHSGSFTVTANASAPSGIASVAFPVVFGSDSATDTTNPFAQTYSWTSSAAASGLKTVTVTDNDADSDVVDFTVTPDTTSPSGQTVSLSGGPNYSTLFVPLVLGNGIDSGAGVDPLSGVVQRASAPLSAGTCGTFGVYAPVTLTSGADLTVATGNCYRYQYSISDNVGNASAPSTPSADARVNSVGPTVTDTAPTEVSGAGDQFWNSATDTVWFRPIVTGSFTLNASATDSSAGGGISQVAFPDVSAVTGWSGSTGGVDTSSPYASPVVYTWAVGAAAPGAKTVTATNTGGAIATDTITISADSAAPTGQSADLTGGPWFGTSVPLTLVPGTDAGAGVDASRSVVERASATLTNGVCGTFGTFVAVTLSNGADTSVASGNCYRYQYKATDNVGNVAPASRPSGDAKIDKTPPTTPSLFFTGFSNTAASGTVVYFRPGGDATFTVTAASADPESGIANYSFPTIPGFTTAGTGPHRTYAVTNAGSVPTPPFSVSSTNAAGLGSGAASFTLVPDATPPTLSVHCNGVPCSKRPYPKAVTVTLSAKDATSGVNTVRWTTDGTDPTADRGNEYLKRFNVDGLTRLKVRAFDKAGNASPLLNLVVNSRANRLVFGGPKSLVAGRNAKFVSLRVTSTRRAKVKLTMTGTGLKKPVRWYFILDSGTTSVRLRLPNGVKHPGTYRIVWTLTSGTQTRTSSMRVTLRR